MEKITQEQRVLLETPIMNLQLSEELKRHLQKTLGKESFTIKLKDFYYSKSEEVFDRKKIEEDLMSKYLNDKKDIKSQYKNILYNMLYCEFVNFLRSSGFNLIFKKTTLTTPVKELPLSVGLQNLLKEIHGDNYASLMLEDLCYSEEQGCCSLEKIDKKIFESKYYPEFINFLRDNNLIIYEEELEKGLVLKK